MSANMPDDHDRRTAVIQVVLSEFTALRKEISDRSNGAWLLMNLNITATATVAGFVLSDKADPLLLLLLPILSPSLGMLYIDHAYNIINIGNYINDELKPILNGMAQASGLLGYEERVDQYERRKLLRFLPLGLPMMIVFSVAPLAALAFSFSSLDAAWAWILWAGGALLIATYLVLWMSFLLIPYGTRAPESPKN